MKITIDTKEDSVHEIKHIIDLLQQILERQGRPNHQTSYESSYSTPYSSPAQRQTQPVSNPFSMFDPMSSPPPRSAAPAPFSMFDAPSTPTTSIASPMTHSEPLTQSIQAQPAEETPSIFDIFGNDKTTPGQTTQETAEDLLHYDEERERRDSSYTFTTY